MTAPHKKKERHTHRATLGQIRENILKTDTSKEKEGVHIKPLTHPRVLGLFTDKGLDPFLVMEIRREIQRALG